MKKRIILLIAFAFVLITPYIGSYIKFHGNIPGCNAKDLPATVTYNPYTGTVLLYVILAVLIEIPILCFLIFGFKKNKGLSPVKESMPVGKYPIWFFPSIIVTLFFWWLMWAKIPTYSSYAFVPLWWGFIFFLDAIVYKRNNGKSLIATRPLQMLILAVISAFSWTVYELLNIFVLECWYYPNVPHFNHNKIVTWFELSYTTVLPAIFEWYWLLTTFKSLTNKYISGKIVNPLSKKTLYTLLLLGIILEFFAGLIPEYFFWVLWVALVPIMVPVMSINGFKTPFTPISKGNWTYVVLIGIATLLNGFVWEFWNFGSDYHFVKALFQTLDKPPTNPNYWKYSVPNLNEPTLKFSEMPVVGYMGYVFFGISSWILWLTFAYILGINPQVTQKWVDLERDAEKGIQEMK